MNFSYRLLLIMGKRGIKQKDLSEMANVPQGAISTYCNEKGLPSSDALLRIAQALGVSMDWLMTGDPSPKKAVKENNHWRDRALRAEEKIKMLKAGLEGMLKKI